MKSDFKINFLGEFIPFSDFFKKNAMVSEIRLGTISSQKNSFKLTLSCRLLPLLTNAFLLREVKFWSPPIVN